MFGQVCVFAWRDSLCALNINLCSQVKNIFFHLNLSPSLIIITSIVIVYVRYFKFARSRHLYIYIFYNDLSEIEDYGFVVQASTALTADSLYSCALLKH